MTFQAAAYMSSMLRRCWSTGDTYLHIVAHESAKNLKLESRVIRVLIRVHGKPITTNQ